MKLITLEELDQLKEVRDNATPGIWKMEITFEGPVHLELSSYYAAGPRHYQNPKNTHYDKAKSDAKYISHVNPEFMQRMEETLRKAIAVIEEIKGEIDRGKQISCIGCCNGNDIPEEELCGACWRIYIKQKMYLLWDWQRTENRFSDFLTSIKSGDV